MVCSGETGKAVWLFWRVRDKLIRITTGFSGNTMCQLDTTCSDMNLQFHVLLSPITFIIPHPFQVVKIVVLVQQINAQRSDLSS